MKWLLVLWITSLGFGSIAQEEFLIKPGVSFDGIEIGSTSLSEVQRRFQTRTNTSGKSVYCGTGPSYYSKSAWLVDTVNSIHFFFKGKLVRRSIFLPQAQRLTEIWVHSSSARLENGIAIGESTIYDVLGFYGDPQPETWNCTFLLYRDMGISFRFSDEGRLTSLNLFEPHSDE